MEQERSDRVWILCLGALVPMAAGFSRLMSTSANLSSAPWVGGVESTSLFVVDEVARWIGPLLPLALVPFLEARRPRRRALGAVLSVCLATLGGLALAVALFPQTAFVTGLLLVPLTVAAEFTAQAAYVGSLTQADRVRRLLLWAVGAVLGSLASGGARAAMLTATGPRTLAALPVLVYAAIAVAIAAVATRALPEFGAREAPHSAAALAPASARRELTGLPGAWRTLFLFMATPVPVLFFREGAPLLLIETADVGGLGLTNEQLGLIVGSTRILGAVGALVAWIMLLRAPVTRWLWAAASLLLLLVPCWVALLVVKTEPVAWLCFGATSAASGFVDLTCLVLVFRVFGDARHYLSALAVTFVGFELVARTIDALVPLASRAGATLPGVPEGAALVAVAAVVALVIGAVALALVPELSRALADSPLGEGAGSEPG